MECFLNQKIKCTIKLDINKVSRWTVLKGFENNRRLRCYNTSCSQRNSSVWLVKFWFTWSKKMEGFLNKKQKCTIKLNINKVSGWTLLKGLETNGRLRCYNRTCYQRISSVCLVRFWFSLSRFYLHQITVFNFSWSCFRFDVIKN